MSKRVFEKYFLKGQDRHHMKIFAFGGQLPARTRASVRRQFKFCELAHCQLKLEQSKKTGLDLILAPKCASTPRRKIFKSFFCVKAKATFSFHSGTPIYCIFMPQLRTTKYEIYLELDFEKILHKNTLNLTD